MLFNDRHQLLEIEMLREIFEIEWFDDCTTMMRGRRLLPICHERETAFGYHVMIDKLHQQWVHMM